MSEFIKQKQIENLSTDLAAKAADNEVLKISNDLSEVNASNARNNLDIYSKTEVQNLVSGDGSGINVDSITERNALTGLSVSDRVFVVDDGDGKWALYIVTAITDGAGSTSSFEKVADEDSFSNALTKEAIKSSYESNANTNAYTDADKTKVDFISATQAADLDAIQSTLTQTSTTANNALSVANGKMDSFTQIKEDFTNLSGASASPVSLTLTHSVALGIMPRVYFNGVLVKSVAFNADTQSLSYTVPFATEASDNISVIYAY